MSDKELIKSLWRKWPRREEAERDENLRLLFYAELKTKHGIDKPYQDVMQWIREWENFYGEIERNMRRLEGK